MRYKWELVGDQDKLTRKVCYLGPHLLEHVEHSWRSNGIRNKYGETDQIMMMASNIYLWDPKERTADLVVQLPLIEYDQKTSHKCLEDWYALNVLAEELFTGDANEPVRTQKR